MLTATEIAGFAGAGLAGAAYVPQISHLIRARCSAGISRLAFEAWLLASILITARAIAIHAGVFIVLGGIQIVATTLIMFYAARYKDMPCPSHLPRPPRAKTATRTGSSADEPGSRRPADLASQQQGDAVHDGSLLATSPRRGGRSRERRGFLALLRVAVVRWGDWASVRSVFDAVTLGTVDYWVTGPVQAPARSSTVRSPSS